MEQGPGASRERTVDPRVRVAAAWTLLGPAFVASVAYVDPGNVAANLTAGARYGYLLVWVLALASVMAMVVQYQSAKLGIVTGSTLSQLVGERLDGLSSGRWLRLLYGAQAIIMAMATDIAEVIGGAIGVSLLTGLPLWLGGLIVGVAVLVLLEVLRARGERAFEVVVSAVLVVVAGGFIAGLFWAPPDPVETLRGLVPQFAGDDSVMIGAAMLGATVMPHAIYVHSTLARDRHWVDGRPSEPVVRLLRIQRGDVALALAVSGTVNVAMLLCAAAALQGVPGVDTIDTAHHVIAAAVGRVPAAFFAVGLLASGLGSAVVGTHAGSRIMKDLLPWQLPAHVRRLVTIVPAVGLLLLHLPPTPMLVTTQLVLSFGIAFALVPLALLTGSRRVMGAHRDCLALRLTSWTVVVAVVTLNLVLMALSL